MFDLWLGDIELTTLSLIFSVLLLPLQLLLCFKCKHKLLRLLPVMLLVLPTVCFLILSATVKGWESLGYLLLAVLTGLMLLVCGLGWGIYGIARWIKRK